MKDHIQWAAPAPLWAAAGEAAVARAAVLRPAVLRFAADTFMEDFLRVLETDPARLGDYLARFETWHGPAPAPEVTPLPPRFLRKLNRLRLAAGGALDQASALATRRALAAASDDEAAGQLKLYQPAHQRYYLVTACLVCRVPGLPDHAPDPNREESVGYVVRRLFQREGEEAPEEYAFVNTPRGAGWQRAAGAAPVEGEERLPLFPSYFDERDGRRRRVFAGVIPVGRREAYMGAAELAAPADGSGNHAAPGATKKTARKLHFRMQIAEPWKSLIERADAANRLRTESPPPAEDEPARDFATPLRDSREQMQTMSWYLLLDLSKYLARYLPKVWAVVKEPESEGTIAGTNEGKLYDELKKIRIEPGGALAEALTAGTGYAAEDVAATMLDALRRLDDPAKGWAAKLESVAVGYDRQQPHALWPDFLFPLADPEHEPPLPSASVTPAPTPSDESGETHALDPTGLSQAVRDRQARVDNLVALVVRALPAESDAPAPAPPLAAQPVMATGETQFVLRCVYERPLCGPLDPPVVSEPTRPFRMAGFFDPDAPARPIRIALPIDTTPAGLRKFDKNTVFMISDALCGQIQRMRGITFGDLVLSVLPWPFHKDLSSKVPKMAPCQSGPGVEIGMMCTLSIPIITICALILLMIIVVLFDFIFKWVPLFIMCFPLPKFKAKG
ncbi:MAG TPA: hypothetical protein VN228_14405 [Pyrinomonadaceae bacterium]|nr:hypothetical protein [Pyrinomonadaceae bacterium]